jgi:UDP-N-acetylmuramoyl-tripeptide--D-alanyl-D-alanine ligase
MTELGLQSKKLHIQLAAHIIKAEVQLLITVGKLAKITAQAVKSTAKHNLQIKSFKDTVSACNNLQELIKDSDIVLVKGSRANKLEMAVAKLKELFAG